MKHGLIAGVIIAILALSGCSNYFHELIPPDDNKILSFSVPGQTESSVITENSISFTAGADTDIRSLIPEITISDKAVILPLTLAYIQAAFPSANVFARAAEMYMEDNFADHIFDLIREDRAFKVPALAIPIDFSGPVDFLVISGKGNIRRYTAMRGLISVTIIGLSAEDKVYDGTTTATISGTAEIVGLVDDDDVSVNYGVAAFENADAGNDKTVTFSGFSLGGADADKYTLSAQPESVTANITGIPLSISGLSVANKVYDGTTTATISGTATINGLMSGDEVTVNYGTAAFADKNVGNGKAINLSGWSLGGADAGNYSLALPMITANITAKAVTVTVGTPSRTLIPFDSADTQYGTTAAFSITVSGSVASDTVSFNLVANSYGITGSAVLSATTGQGTLTYNGTTTVTQTSALSIGLTINNGNYTLSGSPTVRPTVIDGQVETRAIPVTPANITAFNNYANTTNGTTRHYKLTGNITLTGTNNWTAIGAEYPATARFTGSFDGQLNTITGININKPTEDEQGFFGYISTGVSVRNLGLIGGSITGRSQVGGLVGNNYSGTVQNCYMTGVVNGVYQVGGMVGHNSGTVQNCYMTGTVNASNSYIGGVVGRNYSIVQNCYATGSVNGSQYVGGVVGYNWNGTVQNCYATGAVIAISVGSFVGGLIGPNDEGRVQNCVALNPSVRYGSTSANNIGRVAGSTSGTLTNNYARNPMTVQYNWNGTTGTNKAIGAGANTVDGANVTITEAVTATWWTAAGRWSTANGGMAWDFTNVWNPPSGNTLPTLRNMPVGTQNPVIQN